MIQDSPVPNFGRGCRASPFFRRRLHVGAALALVAALVATFSGCGGCLKDPDAKKKEAQRRAEDRKKPKPDFEFGRLTAQPHNQKSAPCFYKSGHWTSVTMAAKANNFNFIGELETAVIDRRGKPAPLPGVAYVLDGSRDVALPKGQPKLLHAALYVPSRSGKVGARCRLAGPGGGRTAFQTRQPLAPMPSYQYHFVVLAREPERYGYLRGLESIRPPWDELVDEQAMRYYRVSLLGATRRTPLPAEGLFWTSIAYVLWDDAEPSHLTRRQQQAMLDWLHWGGQLILSGPDTLDTLKNSFLAPYLPAEGEGTRPLGEPELDALDRRFTLPLRGNPGRALVVARPWTGVKLRLLPGATWVPAMGDLLAERRVGRGRILLSAFRLTGRELTGWQGFDNFFNACLMRRPPRRYRVGKLGETQLTWADGKLHRLDARQTCKLRFFSRDTGGTLAGYGADAIRAGQDDLAADAPPPVGTGVAAWNDFSAAADQARASLLEAARIEIPGRMFVVWVVGVYLLVLAPVNWALFKTLDRVEWAWIAAPLVALGCTGVVIRLARLDIGFARSVTELAVVELQGDYPRAHVTRYNALYTSLSTTYGFRSEDPGTLIQPFPTVSRPDEFRFLPGQSAGALDYRYGKDVSLRGYLVSSNSTGLIHGEQFVDVGEPAALIIERDGSWAVHNRGEVALEGAGVMRKTVSGELRTAWIGTLEPAAGARLEWTTRYEGRPEEGWWPARREASPLARREATSGSFNLRGLLDLAEDPEDMDPGETRLVAWMDAEIAGLETTPSAPQSRRVAVVVAHLRYDRDGPPRSDVNTREDVEKPPAKSPVGRGSP